MARLVRFVTVSRKDPDAATVFENVITSSMCEYKAKNKEANGIPQWWLNDLLPTFKYLLYYESEGGRRDTRIDGFLVCSDKTLNFDGQHKFLYVDAVCSKFRKGKALLLQAEVLAKELGYTTIAMSALPHVVAYYRKLGYKTVFDNCHTETRGQRNFRRTQLNPYEDLADGVWMSKCLTNATPSHELQIMYDRFRGQFDHQNESDSPGRTSGHDTRTKSKIKVATRRASPPKPSPRRVSRPPPKRSRTRARSRSRTRARGRSQVRTRARGRSQVRTRSRGRSRT